MNEEFIQRVRSAAITAWWTVLVAAAFVTLQWMAYMFVMSARPTWVLSMWGPDMTWASVQNLWIMVIAIVKVAVWIMALLALWLSLWSGRLRHT
mgnify:CR=1 FL=1